MKKLIILVMFMAFVFLPLTSKANSCERYGSELTGQCFIITVDEVDFDLCFSDSVFGPCPGGQVVLSYQEAQTIVEIPMTYSTDPDIVMIEGLEFILIDDKLILLPENPLIFDRKQEEN